MNHMNEVAKMLGVEMGEEFSLNLFKREKVSGYYFDRFGLQRKNTCSTYPETLGELIQGTHEIVKLPFKPKEGEPYWFWRKFASDENGKTVWYLDAYDDYFEPCYTIPTINYMLGNCYRTEAECEADTAMKERIENMERCKW